MEFMEHIDGEMDTQERLIVTLFENLPIRARLKKEVKLGYRYVLIYLNGRTDFIFG